MRVISGKYKGRKIIAPEGDRVRPTSDKVKECVFDILQFRISDTLFVDLFSGCGGMGIEALSRGAKKVIFVDNSRQSLHYIKANTENCGATDFEIMLTDYFSALLRIKDADFIYADPPYAEEEIYRNLLTACYPALKDGGQIIIEHRSGTTVDVQDGYELKSVRKYGYVTLSIFEKVAK